MGATYPWPTITDDDGTGLTGTVLNDALFDDIKEYVDFLGFMKDDDADTKIQVEEGADDDTIRMDIEGTEMFNWTTSTLNINAGLTDCDVIIGGDNDATLFKVDAGNDEVFLGGFAGFDEIDNGNAGAADTIDWGTSNKQKSTLTEAVEYTFTAPASKGNLLLIVHDTNSEVITWPGTVVWPAGTVPTPSTGAADIDIYTFYWDGSAYYGNSSHDFS